MLLDIGGVFLGIGIAVLGFVVVVLVCVIVLRLLAFILPAPREASGDPGAGLIDASSEPDEPLQQPGGAAPVDPGDAAGEEKPEARG